MTHPDPYALAVDAALFARVELQADRDAEKAADAMAAVYDGYWRSVGPVDHIELTDHQLDNVADDLREEPLDAEILWLPVASGTLQLADDGDYYTAYGEPDGAA